MENSSYLIIILIGGIALLSVIRWLFKFFSFKIIQRNIQTKLLLGYKINKPFSPIESDKRASETITESNYFLSRRRLHKLTRNSKIV